jgi:hypothetical protein
VHKTMRMEALANSYVKAVAAYCGYQVVKPEIDDDSVDGILIGSEGKKPRVDFQLKSTGAHQMKNGTISYPLNIKNYNDLIIETLTPRILIVFLMPEDEGQWIDLCHDSLSLKKCAYWTSLLGREDIINTSTKTIEIKEENIFSPESLRMIMNKAEWRIPL